MFLWEVENKGVAPDVDVRQRTRDAVEGRDSQLEKAIEVAMELLEDEAPRLIGQPEDPVRVPGGAR